MGEGKGELAVASSPFPSPKPPPLPLQRLLSLSNPSFRCSLWARVWGRCDCSFGEGWFSGEGRFFGCALPMRDAARPCRLVSVCVCGGGRVYRVSLFPISHPPSFKTFILTESLFSMFPVGMSAGAVWSFFWRGMVFWRGTVFRVRLARVRGGSVDRRSFAKEENSAPPVRVGGVLKHEGMSHAFCTCINSSQNM